MDLNLLPVFVAIYDLRSVSVAAETLGMSQSGVSTALRRLRSDFNDVLFLRTAQGMEPSARAKELREPIGRMMGIVDGELRHGIAFHPCTAEDVFNVMASDMAEYVFLPWILAAIRKEAPRVTVNCIRANRADYSQNLSDSDVDLFIGHFDESKSTNIMQTQVGVYDFGCFVNNDHPFSRGKVSMEMLAGAGHLSVNPQGKSQEAVDQFYKRHSIKRDIICTISSFLTAPSIIRQTDLVATLPCPANSLCHYVGIAKIDLDVDMPTAPLRLYWPRAVHDDERHRWFRQIVTREIAGYSNQPQGFRMLAI